jgi:hypothetical protein
VNKQLAWIMQLDPTTGKVKMGEDGSDLVTKQSYINNLKHRGDYEVEEKEGQLYVYLIEKEA